MKKIIMIVAILAMMAGSVQAQKWKDWGRSDRKDWWKPIPPCPYNCKCD